MDEWIPWGVVLLYKPSFPGQACCVVTHETLCQVMVQKTLLDASLTPFRYTSHQNHELNKPIFFNVTQSEVLSLSLERL